jgi:hypothetical protein
MPSAVANLEFHVWDWGENGLKKLVKEIKNLVIQSNK